MLSDPYALQQEKARLRGRLRAQARQLYGGRRAEISQKIFSLLVQLPEFRSADTIFGFAGTQNEPDTLPFLYTLLQQGRQLALPRCEADGRMQFHRLSAPGQLTPGRFGILQPPADAPILHPGPGSLLLAPCLGCDLRGVRLGHGGGYYDRYLAGADHPWVVLCPEALLCSEIPRGPFDCAAPLLLTEQRLYRIGGSVCQIGAQSS